MTTELSYNVIVAVEKGEKVSLRKKINEQLTKMNIKIAYVIGDIRVSRIYRTGVDNPTVTYGSPLLQKTEEGQGPRDRRCYQEMDVFIDASINTMFENIQVTGGQELMSVELSVEILSRKLEPAPDGYIYLNIPVPEAFLANAPSERIHVEHLGVESPEDTIYANWLKGFGHFEPSYDGKGNIIGFNLIPE